MTAAKHTPGPWLADDGDGSMFGIFAPNGEPLAYLSECSPYCRADGLPRDEGAKPSWQLAASERPLTYARAAEHAANARLIAAAPGLLEALQPFVAHNSSDDTITITVSTSDVARARAAIAKATGGTS